MSLTHYYANHNSCGDPKTVDGRGNRDGRAGRRRTMTTNAPAPDATATNATANNATANNATAPKAIPTAGTRRARLRALALAGAVTALAAACGAADDNDRASPDRNTETSRHAGDAGGGVPVPERLELVARTTPGALADPALAGAAIDALGGDLFVAASGAAGADANVVLSPASIAIALALLEPGAVGEAQQQLRSALRITDPVAYHAAMNALEQRLEGRVAPAPGPGEDPGEFVARIANAAYLQQGVPFEQAYLDAVGAAYGAVLNTVDYSADPDAVARQINDFVAAETNDRIPELIPAGALSADTVLTLVNALYLNASWREPFAEGATRERPFTLRSGMEVTVPMMTGSSDSSARGDGWVGASKSYVGGISAQFILPDEGRFDELAADPAALFAAFEDRADIGSSLVMPRFETRVSTNLTPVLDALGLGALAEPGHLTAIAPDPRLVVDSALHETYLAIDEEGIEAAAATAVIVATVSAPVGTPVPVVLDRPFLFRIVDSESGATLFIGRIMNPTA